MSQQRETIMMQGRTSMVVMTLLGVLLCMAVAQAKEIPFDYTYCLSGAAIVVLASKELTVAIFESRGIIRRHIDLKRLDKHILHCIWGGRFWGISGRNDY